MGDQIYTLEMKGIVKEYFGNRVLNNVSLNVKPGEIVSLIGENGAGKSTIMNILFGMPVISETGGFEGRILIEGIDVHIQSPMEAMDLGIGMVHQEFMLINDFDVTENVKLNRENTRKIGLSKLFGNRLNLLDRPKMYSETKEILDTLDVEFGEKSRVGNLPIGHKQFVEIARELDKRNTKLIVLDEPTAVLTESESSHFLKAVQKVAKEKGISFIFISHKLNEVKKISDRTYILRDGNLVGQYPTKDLSVIEMSELMVGREVRTVNKDTADRDLEASVCLELKAFSVFMPGEIVNDINLTINKGEIFGIGGLSGHGKIAIANGILGIYPASGSLKLYGEDIEVNNTTQVLNHDIAFVSEDRRGVGLMMDESIELNIAIAALRLKDDFVHNHFGIKYYDHKKAKKHAKAMIEKLDIRCIGPRQKVLNLSGGNQQKVCLARAFTLDPDILFVSEPTRGIDVGAKQMILDSLLQLNREKGTTIVMTSSELEELRSICDRIAIITEGSVAGILKPDDKNYKFGLLMSGIDENVESEGHI